MADYHADIKVLKELTFGSDVLETRQESVQADNDEEAQRAAKRLALSRVEARGGSGYVLILKEQDRTVLIHDPVEHRHGTGH